MIEAGWTTTSSFSLSETYEAPEEMQQSIFIGPAAAGGLLGRGGEMAPEGALRR